MGDYHHYYPFISQIEIKHDILTHQEECKSNLSIAFHDISFSHCFLSLVSIRLR